MNSPAPTSRKDVGKQLREVTPARLFTGRAGSSYPTATLLELRADHAAARDAVTAELDLGSPPMAELVETYGLIAVQTQAGSTAQYLLRPDLGRRLSPAAQASIAESCPPGVDVQILIGDGLSATAVAVQVPRLLPTLIAGCAARGWSTGQTIVIRRCRVGVLNDIGDLLAPTVTILLIGERPGLATAESLSAYLAYRPQTGHTDADRNLLSNIHDAGIPPQAAVERILALTQAMMTAQRSGVEIKESAAGPATLAPLTTEIASPTS
jgi:ethanolamine ammonia-lyase small subunit